MTIKIEETTTNSGVEYTKKPNPHDSSYFYDDVTAPTGRERFDITISGTADDRQEVIAFLAQLAELAEEGVVSTKLVGTAAEHAAASALAATAQASGEQTRAKRQYTRRQIPGGPQPAAKETEQEPTLPSVPATPPPPAEKPAPVAVTSHLAGGGTVDTGQPLVAPPKGDETSVRSKQADTRADESHLTPEELAAYEKANPFTPPAAAPTPAPAPAVSSANPLRSKVLECKNIRDLLSCLAFDLGERADRETGAITNEPTKEAMLAYAERMKEHLAEVAMFKTAAGYDFGRVLKGIENLYG